MRNLTKLLFTIGCLFISNALLAQLTTTKDSIVHPTYKTDSVVLYNKTDSIIIGATLPYPLEKKFPAVVLVSGTGKQDRDGPVAGHKLFATIADHLTNNRIAALRFLNNQ